jgi:iron(III) transport system ATP-binding protein
VTEPKILLFDEPLSNLDAKLREHVRVELRELQRRLKITSIYVTHDQSEALVISDRIVIMDAGHIEQIGDPFSIYRYPKTSFVANFIGLANINSGRIVSREGDLWTVQTEVGLLSIRPDREIEKEEILFSWRPEDVVPYSEGMKNRLAGRISQAIFMGNITDLFVEVEGKTIRAQMGSEVHYREGEAIVLSVPEQRFHILA